MVSPYRGSIFLTTVYPTSTHGAHGNSGGKTAGKHLFSSGKGRKRPESAGNRYSCTVWDIVQNSKNSTKQNVQKALFYAGFCLLESYSNLLENWHLTTVRPLLFPFLIMAKICATEQQIQNNITQKQGGLLPKRVCNTTLNPVNTFKNMIVLNSHTSTYLIKFFHHFLCLLRIKI